MTEGADREQAKERMRRLRKGGSTSHDRARQEAIRDLIALHRPEFQHLLHRALLKRTHVREGDPV